MKINKIEIKNFRGIQEQELALDHFNMFIGNNGTNKTNVLEAINFALSPAFLSSRIRNTDFYCGEDNEIEINLTFEQSFHIKLPDGYTTQEVGCNEIQLKIKKRERKTSGKVLSDAFTLTHIVLPVIHPRNDSDESKKWEIKRKNNSLFKFDERLLAFGVFESEELPRSFYFGKDRERQLQKGFNTSFSSIIEDLNWRYAKGIRNSSDIKDLFEKIDDIENQIVNLSKFEEHDVIKELNKRIKDFGLEEIKLSFIDKSIPFDQSYFSKKAGKLTLPVKYLGSGIEMIYATMFLDALASLSKEKLIILIDEPELHLHPRLQEKFANYLHKLSQQDKYQVIISTHSPVFIKNLVNKDKVQSFIFKPGSENFVIPYKDKKSLFPWGPTWGEINYFAYKYPTIEFFNELYGYLMELTEKYNQADFDDFLCSKDIPKDKIWIPEKGGTPQNEQQVTLPTFVRNKIHHPENKTMKDENFDLNDLKKTIEELVKVLMELSSDVEF